MCARVAHLPEDAVLAVEEGGLLGAQEELRSVGVRPGAAEHRPRQVFHTHSRASARARSHTHTHTHTPTHTHTHKKTSSLPSHLQS